jgi:hypothetical protein
VYVSPPYILPSTWQKTKIFERKTLSATFINDRGGIVSKLRNRKPTRLLGYDYSQAGWYFVTICTHGRAEWFGTINDNQMQLNVWGNIVQQKLLSH